MKKKALEELLESVRQMKKIQRGEIKPARVTTSEDLAAYFLGAKEIRGIRAKLSLSQSEFAALIGVPIRTVQEWDQGRRSPQGPARALLRVAAKRPDAILEALHPHRKKAG